MSTAGSGGPIAHYPGRAPIDAYGNGGFRFADMSHRGSLLCLPSGVFAWSVADVADLAPDSFQDVLRERDLIDFVLLGTGRTLVFPPPGVRAGLAQASLGLEIMDTGAACRTYNVLLAEQRRVAAALIAVD